MTESLRADVSDVPHHLPIVVSQHVAEAAFLRSIRTPLLTAAGINLRDLARHDERIAAHLDGVAIAREFGRRSAIEALASPGRGEVFVASVCAIAAKEWVAIDRLCSLSETLPETRPGLTSAFGWMSAAALTGFVARLFGHASDFRRSVAIAACALHRVDPGTMLDVAIRSADVSLRARSLTCVGEVGRLDLLPVCMAAAEAGQDDLSTLAGACSAALLGNRGSALELARRLALAPGASQRRALRLALLASNDRDTYELLKRVAAAAPNHRTLVEGAGLSGNSIFVPWLFAQMREEANARVAGEAFSLISGADLKRMKLDRDAPEEASPGPTDDPDDPNVDIDPDEGLPWPDAKKVEVWWHANESRFRKGTRYFMGKPVTREHCIDVLKNGYQRHRILAAHYLCLLDPGTPLFNTSAPAWRQQRLLAAM